MEAQLGCGVRTDRVHYIHTGCALRSQGQGRRELITTFLHHARGILITLLSSQRSVQRNYIRDGVIDLFNQHAFDESLR